MLTISIVLRVSFALTSTLYLVTQIFSLGQNANNVSHAVKLILILRGRERVP